LKECDGFSSTGAIANRTWIKPSVGSTSARPTVMLCRRRLEFLFFPLTVGLW